MSDSKNFYVTTPIYYVNDKPHIGHAYTTILADVFARYHRLFGDEVFFLTGTDEHGQKVQQAAIARGVSPQEHVDEFHQRFKKLWDLLDISNDKFIRTTSKHHVEYIQNILTQLNDRGEIYSKEYEGWYSVGEERFFTKDELVDGKDPVSGKSVEWISEKNYFFRMGSYRDKLLKHIEKNPEFILPDFRRNEVLGFLKQDLRDLCISRPKSRLAWGIPLPFDEDYVTYVWVDALFNYRSGVDGFEFSDGSSAWPVDYQLIGKDILTTHSIYWTTMLLALDIPLPKHILAHGWWLNSGAKMSKSDGSAIDPIPYVHKWSVDVFRYFVIREMVLGQDASFSDEAYTRRNDSDLANDLGNGLNRITRQIAVHFDGKIPAPGILGEEERELESLARALLESLPAEIKATHLSQAVESILGLVRGVNRYLEKKAPWKVAKDPKRREELATILWHGAEALRLALVMLSPVIPSKARAGLTMLGAGEVKSDDLDWSILKGGENCGTPAALFPRMQEKKTKSGNAQQLVSAEAKLSILCGRIKEVVDHPDADSLFVITLDLATEERTICAGLKKHYSTEELKGRKVVCLANLKPARIRGVESRGMLLAADGPEGEIILLDPGESLPGTVLTFGDTTPVPKAKLSIKDFDKAGLVVQKGKVLASGKVLTSPTGDVRANTPDNAEVH